MKFRFALAASLLALAACQPSTPPASEAAAPPAGETAAAETPANCNATAEAPWGPIGASDHPSYRIEAYTNGSICEAAVVTLAIRARDGFPVYVWAGQTQYLINLNEVKDPAAMPKALADWIDPVTANTGDLPPWETTEGQPQRAEFPFMPAAGMDKATYEEIRAAKAPSYCFPQGMESMQCVALRDGGIEDIGIQLFPG